MGEGGTLFSFTQLDRMRRQVMSTQEAYALADAVVELVSAAHEVDDTWRETHVYYTPLDNAIKKLIHAVTTPDPMVDK